MVTTRSQPEVYAAAPVAAVPAASAASADPTVPTVPTGAPVAVARAWTLLGGVMDPEVPVVSIVELGIVRDVEVVVGGLRVTLTPTYSGCPAMDAIAADIRTAFATDGIDVDIATALSPAWTTDWMAPEAKARLAAFGIAPPQQRMAARVDVSGISPLRRRARAIGCPRCGSIATSLVAQFGSTACKALYRCDDCGEPFDYFKPH